MYVCVCVCVRVCVVCVYVCVCGVCVCVCVCVCVLVVGKGVGGALVCQSVVTVGDHGQRAGCLLGTLPKADQQKHVVGGMSPCPVIVPPKGPVP